MTIDHISVGDVNAISKVNLAIDEANKVSGKAEQTAVDNLSDALGHESDTREQAINDERNAWSKSVSDEADARRDEDAVRPTFGEASGKPIRPGEAPKFFSADLDGPVKSAGTLPVGSPAITNDGSVWSVAGAATIATICAWRVEPGRQYRARFVVRRTADTEDPANDAIRLALRWLKADKSGISTAILADLVDVIVDSGRLEYAFNFSSADADNIDVTSPAGAAYVRPFVRMFGAGVTSVEVIEITDISSAVDFSPDVSAFVRQLSGFSYRLETFETQFAQSQEDIEASRDASWFETGTLADARLSSNVVFSDREQEITAAKVFEAKLRMRDALILGDAGATGGGGSGMIVGDGDSFSLIPSDGEGGYNTLKEFRFDPGLGVWLAEGGFGTTGTFTATNDAVIGGKLNVSGAVTFLSGSMNGVVIGATTAAAATFTTVSFTDAGTTRDNLGVYSKAYVDNLIAAQDAMVFKGVIDCSGNPNYPAADRGWTYRVSVAGKIGGSTGVVVEIGDILICLTDGTASGNQATVGANWTVVQTNIDGALTTASIGVSVQAYAAALAAISSLSPAANDFLQYKAGAWSNRTPVQVKADLSSQSTISTDAAFSLTVGTSAENVRHTGTLTADRAITLATSGATAGSRFRITRTGSGAFNLSVGGLKNLNTNSWADVVYDGAAWYLAAYGTL